ncbi:hypothetical protein BJ138DRAFT_928553 [Hygrophoropsis aurantiaca]|uniref:Uncharacterized protein n=1 Tax=Hygrophoropsis aurantiaca TaxID=72124 RepID=A0ACB8AE23_9AGAM|nr:hypothetical protein BJ138DRAFT_928553 [Hygrophoropsis aurantiaca]
MNTDINSEEIYVNPQTLRAVFALRLNTYTTLVGTTILVYDYLLTYERERKYIWPAPWSIIKCLYLATRYLPFFDTLVVLIRMVTPGLSLNTCYVLAVMNCYLYAVGMGMSELILMIRTWAVWERNRKVGIGLAVYFVLLTTPTWWITAQFANSFIFGAPPTPSSGCMLIHNSALNAVDWVLLVMIELGVLILMIVKSARDYKQRRSPGLTLSKVILRDGIAYYINLFALSAVNIIIICTRNRLISFY